MVKCKHARISNKLSQTIDDLSLKFNIPKTLASELIATNKQEHFIMNKIPKSKELELSLFTMRKIKIKRRRK